MASDTVSVFCECGQPLPTARPDDPVEGRVPCPSCGSKLRSVDVQLHEDLHLEDHVDTHSKHPRPTYKAGRRSKPAVERWAGDVPSDDGIWRDRRRLVDREGDWYEETVYNPDGTVRHHQAEPLSEHLRHGSDRKKQERDPGA